jgi:hypothetical protein
VGIVAGLQGSFNSAQLNPYITGNGRFVGFRTDAPLVPDDRNGEWDFYVRDRLARTTERLSVSSTGGDANGDVMWQGGVALATLSEDGRYALFASDASNLVDADGDENLDVFVRDRVARKTTFVSSGFASAGNALEMPFFVSLSRDGRFVNYESNLLSLDQQPGYEAIDVYRYDTLSQTTTVVTTSRTGQDSYGLVSRISGDGKSVVFWSDAPNLDGDTTCHPDRPTFLTSGGGTYCKQAFVWQVAGPR